MQKKDRAKNILIKNIKLLDISNSNNYTASIHIKESKIVNISRNKLDFDNLDNSDNTTVIDGDDLLLTDSFLDMHVHFRDPGDGFSENIESGINSALRGGITGVCTMPNTNPVIDDPFLVEYIINKAKGFGFDIFPVAAITKKIIGKELTEFGLLKESGVYGLSDDGNCLNDSKLMFEALRYAKQFGLLLILHEEDVYFSKNGLMNEGKYSTLLGLEGISPLSEELIVSRDISLAKKTKSPVHITHVSTKGTLDIIRHAKEEGVSVTCDVTPHHIFFNDSFVKDYDTNLKVNPPIRSIIDQEAIIEGIKDGTIDVIASDHAPHRDLHKNTTFKDAAFGAIGMETLFKACYTKLCKGEGIKLEKILKMIIDNPAKILKAKRSNNLQKGVNPSLALIDLNKKAQYSKKDIVSKSSNSPFIGKDLEGEIVCTINKGKIVFKNKDYLERFN